MDEDGSIRINMFAPLLLYITITLLRQTSTQNLKIILRFPVSANNPLESGVMRGRIEGFDYAEIQNT
jgi:hypothetical protein